MNFGNPPFFPKTTKLVCINGSHEEIEINRAADINLLCDPGVFLDTLKNLKRRETLLNRWMMIVILGGETGLLNIYFLKKIKIKTMSTFPPFKKQPKNDLKKRIN